MTPLSPRSHNILSDKPDTPPTRRIPSAEARQSPAPPLGIVRLVIGKYVTQHPTPQPPAPR